MKPWLRFWRKRSRRFDALPIGTRGLFWEILAKVDDDGWLHLGDSSLASLWLCIAAHPRERRTLAKHLDTLMGAGSVEKHPDGWRIPSLQKHQTAKKGRHGVNTKRTRSEHEVSPNLPESFNSASGELEGDREKERNKERAQRTHPRISPPATYGTNPEPDPEPAGVIGPEAGATDGDRELGTRLRRSYLRRFEAATKSTHPHPGKLGGKAVEVAARIRQVISKRDSADDCAKAMLDEFFGDRRATAKGFPFHWLVHDPDQYFRAYLNRPRFDPGVAPRPQAVSRDESRAAMLAVIAKAPHSRLAAMHRDSERAEAEPTRAAG